MSIAVFFYRFFFVNLNNMEKEMHQMKFDQPDTAEPALKDEKDRLESFYGAKNIRLGKDAAVARGKVKKKENKSLAELKAQREKIFKKSEEKSEAERKEFQKRRLENSRRAMQGLPPLPPEDK